MLMKDRDQGERVTTLASCINVFEKQKTDCNRDLSLSRREGSSKNKLFACLYVRTPLIGRNNNAKIKQMIS